MAKPRKRRPVATKIKKKCTTCGKEKTSERFYKVDSPLFADGMINTCSDCIRASVDINSTTDVISFLRQIDKPFIENYWNEALQSGRYPLGEYIRKVNSMIQLKGKTFDHSDGIEGISKLDLQASKMPETLETESGDIVEYSDDLVARWGAGYKKHEYLKLEKFYYDMLSSYQVTTANHKQMLMQLAKLSVEMDSLLYKKEYASYAKVSKVYDDMLKSSGMRPVDRKGADEERGLRSFSQIFEEVEKRGFVKPPPPHFDEDIVDQMIVSLANYYHRLVGKEIMTDVPDDLKESYSDYFDDEVDGNDFVQ